MQQISNTILETKLFSNRVRIAIGFILLLVIILLIQILNLQILNHQYYKVESEGNRLGYMPIVPTRGRIFDRNGLILADNKISFSLELVLEKIKNIDGVFNTLEINKIITANDIKNFHKIKKNYKNFNYIPILENVPEDVVAKFLVSKYVPGLAIRPKLNRVYPNKKLASHILGYVSKLNEEDMRLYNTKDYENTTHIGKVGIEKQYELDLHGKVGKSVIERNVEGRMLNEETIIQPVPGDDLYLTIDIKLQKIAEKTLKNKRGSIILINVKNGEILAAASAPNYDPNFFVDGISEKDYKKLNNSKSKPLFDRAIKGQYPPGSTIKPLIALAGLELSVINEKSRKYCPGWYSLPNHSHKYRDWKRSGHGHQTVEDAIAESCDVFFYELAYELGIDTIRNYLKQFNLGKTTNIDIPGELPGVLPSKKWKREKKGLPWYIGETVIAGIGQGFITATPLQLAVFTAAIANKGILVTPKLLRATKKINKPIEMTKPSKYKTIAIKDVENWDIVTKAMEKSIYGIKGTARRLNNNLKYTLAGKTGTAQVFGLDAEEEYIASQIKETLRDHALFVAFAPIKEPEVAIAVVVENAGSGSSKAAPLAKKVLDVYFKNKI